MKIFSTSCLKASYLVEKKLHTKLNIKERIQLKIHLCLCNKCSRYNKEAILIDQLTIESIAQNEMQQIFSAGEIDKLKKKILVEYKNVNYRK